MQLRDAAESRRGRGLATLPEVLQAREQSARAAYDLQESLAADTDARMALLEAMGVRPTTAVSVASLAGRALPAAVEDAAQKLVDRALAQRPDLMARVATADIETRSTAFTAAASLAFSTGDLAAPQPRTPGAQARSCPALPTPRKAATDI